MFFVFVNKCNKIKQFGQLLKVYILYIYVDDKQKQKENLINKILYSYLPYLLPLLTHTRKLKKISEEP